MSEHYPEDNQSTGINPEQLPPLEPTAQVPPVHSDKLNDPKYWEEKFQGRSAVVPAEHRDEIKPRRSRGVRIIAGIAGVAVLGGGAFAGVKLFGGNANDSPEGQNRPTATAPITPGSSENTPDTVESTQEAGKFSPTELTAERYQDGGQLLRAYNAELNDWLMSGGSPETRQASLEAASSEDYLNTVAKKYDDEYINALFVSDWQDRPQLVKEIQANKDLHGVVLNANIRTTDTGESADQEPYEQAREVTSVKVVAQGKEAMEVSYRFKYSSNADKNRADLFVQNVNGIDGGETVTFINENGVWKIADITYFGG